MSPVSQDELIGRSTQSVFASINMLAWFPKVMNQHSWENHNVQNFVKSTGLHFDVIVTEDFFSESYLMFAHKHKAPVVAICRFTFNTCSTQNHTKIFKLI